MSTEGTGDVSGFALLEKDNAHQKKTYNNVDDNKKRNEHVAVRTFEPEQRGWSDRSHAEPCGAGASRISSSVAPLARGFL